MAIIYKNVKPSGLTKVLNSTSTVVEWVSPDAGSVGSYNGKDSFTLTPSVTVTNGFGATVFSVLSGTLPAGTNLDTTTGEITGTLDNTTGGYSFTIRAINNSIIADRAFSATVTQIASVDWVSPAAGSLGSFNGGDSFVFSPVVDVIRGSGATVYSVQSGTLPLGTSLNTSTGEITGTLDAAPYDDVAEIYNFTIRATNNGLHADRSFTASVAEVTLVSWNSPAAGALGASAGGSSFSFTANTTVLDPVGSTVYSVATGALPNGTSLNTATGAITGTLVNEASSYSFTIRVTNNGVSADRAFTGTVTATTVVTWNSPAAGALGAFDGGSSFSLTANTSVVNASGSTTYSVSSGTLPAGTTLNTSTGVVSGTLTNTASSFSFTIRATNNSVTSDRSFTGSVTAITLVTWNSPAAGALGTSTGNSSFSFTPSITVVNPVGSTVYSVSSGTLPAGTSINSSTGAVTGTLTNADSNYAFTIRATNNGITADRAFTGSVSAVVVTWVSPTAGDQGSSAGGSSYSFTSNVSVTNGIGPVGSIAFNGSSKVSVPGGLISGNFSMEAWVYPTSGGSSTIFSDGAYNAGSSLMVFLNSGGVYVNSGSAGGNIVNGAGSVPLSTWSHIVWERSGSTNTIYVNGSAVTTFSYSGQFGASGFAIGSTTANQYQFTGNMTNIRLVTSTVYNGNFTKPTSPPTAISGTALLLKATTSGALLTDSSGVSTSVTNSGTTWSASSPFAELTFSVLSGSLPAGTTLDTATGIISGTLTNTPSSYSFTLRATASGVNADRAFTGTVTGTTVVTWNSPAAGALGASAGGSTYSFTANTSVVNAVGSTVYSVSSGTLPAGTSLDTATGIISGTLTNAASSYSFTIRATNNEVTSDRAFTGSVTLTITYAVSPSVTSVDEGNAVTFTVTTVGVADATTLYWTNNGTTSAADFSDSANSGSFTITSNSGTFTRTLSADLATEGSETIIAQIRTVSTSGTVVATANTVTVNDTSLAPSITYTITPNVSSANEGSTVAYTVATGGTGVADGTSLYWTNNGTTTAADFTEGGSIAFTGNGQYVSVPSNATFAFGGDFTVEAWIYITPGSGLFNVFNVGGAAAGSYSLYWNNSTSKFDSTRYGTAGGTTTNTYATGQWMHVAAVRSSGTAKLYINGVADAGATVAMPSISASTNVSIGLTWGTSYNQLGYISNLRVVSGTALYTSNFTPSTTPLTAVTNTALLLNNKSSAAAFTDSSTNAFTLTNSGTSFNNTNPFAGGSIYQNDMSGAYPILPTGSQGTNFTFSGDFTIEAWVYYTSATGTDSSVYAASQDGTTNYFAFNINMSTNAYSVYLNGGQTSIGSHGISANTWAHVALVRSGSTITAYTNGVSKGTVTNSSTLGYSTLSVHRLGTGAATRYITNFRMVKSAVYTTNFTPPTATLTAIANTVILLNADSSSKLLTDSSSNNYTVTTFGTPTWSPLNPVVSALTDGTFKVYSNSATITRTLRNDLATEGSESLILNVRTGSTSGTVVATANTVTVNDTSLQPTSYLAVAGGGGGGGGYAAGSNPGGAGGGAGGLLASTVTLTAGATYTITVGNGGNGGAASTGEGNPGANGANSSIIGTAVSVIAIGGGGGGAYNTATNGAGKAGGSGGGGTAGGAAGSAGTGTAGQGNNGGRGGGNFGGGGGGGGGSSAVGTAAAVNAGGAGGAGTTSSITGSAVAYAGGGGGSGGGAGAAGAAGAAGGGAGNLSANGGNATVNTGSGGGGGGCGYAGGTGATGVVIISIPTSLYTGTVTGSPTVTTSGSNTIIQFTANGTYVA